MSDLAPDPLALRQYVDALYGTADSGYTPLWHHPTKHTTWVPATDQTAIVEAALALGAGGNLYCGLGLHPQPRGASSRGGAAGVCGIPGLWFDFDLAGPGHHATNLPPARDAQRLIRQAVPVPPSYVVNSGGGLHLYWLLQEFWHFADEGERRHAARLLASLQWLVISAARAHGWILDTTSDLSRVLRPAGTINRKPGLPERPVRVLQAVRRRYSIEDLEAVLPLDDPAFRHGTRDHVPRSGPARAQAALWSRITDQCAYLRHCEHDAARLTEPEWHAAMSILGRCHNGNAVAHRISAPYPGYTPDETSTKFTNAFNADRPLRCETIRADRGGEPWCSTCPHWGRISSPITLGAVPGYVYASYEDTPATTARADAS